VRERRCWPIDREKKEGEKERGYVWGRTPEIGFIKKDLNRVTNVESDGEAVRGGGFTRRAAL